jgi:hypothetical protein
VTARLLVVSRGSEDACVDALLSGKIDIYIGSASAPYNNRARAPFSVRASSCNVYVGHRRRLVFRVAGERQSVA